MGRTHLLVLAFGSALCCMSVPTVAQQPESALASLNFLVGDWQGEGGREPGQGTGDFSFQPDLQRPRPRAQERSALCGYLDQACLRPHGLDGCLLGGAWPAVESHVLR